MTDVELDERITTLEENGGGDNSVNSEKFDCIIQCKGPLISYHISLYVRNNTCYDVGCSSFQLMTNVNIEGLCEEGKKKYHFSPIFFWNARINHH